LLCLFFLSGIEGKIRRNYIGKLNEGLLRRGVPLTSNLDPQWFTQQKIDHFNNNDLRVWNQKYYVNTTYWKVCNPIFFVLGGEGPISETYVGDHFVSGYYASIFGAMIVALEHRYYGDSNPTDSSSSNLKLLSSEQALADLVVFRQYIVNSFQTPDSKWILFGGSYSGALSAWAREKYPHIFRGSIASSGPVHAVEDFYQYFEVVQTSLGSTCSAIIQKATQTMDQLLTTDEGKAQLSSQFNTCTPIQSDLDSTTFLEDISDPICEVVQYNKDNRGTSAVTIDQLCAIFQNGQSDPVAAWVQAYQAVYGTDCIEASYTQMINELQATSAGRCWTWQTCTEFGYYQTGESAAQPFSARISLDYFRQICQDLFAPIRVSPDTDWANNNFGALDLKKTVSNTYFGDGTIDPWHALAILPVVKGGTTGSELLPLNSATYLINGTAHCADLYAPSPNDPNDLTFARNLQFDLLSIWLS